MCVSCILGLPPLAIHEVSSSAQLNAAPVECASLFSCAALCLGEIPRRDAWVSVVHSLILMPESGGSRVPTPFSLLGLPGRVLVGKASSYTS